MFRGKFVLFVLLLQLISLMTDMKIDAMEMYPDGNELHTRSSCPDNEGMGCETDSDCMKQISGGELSEQCSKCVCWNVPLCDIKKCHHEFIDDSLPIPPDVDELR